MDKNNSKEFEDQSWESMGALLDKEMPVKKKRKAFLIYILLALTTLTTTIYSTVLKDEKHEGAQTDLEKDKPLLTYKDSIVSIKTDLQSIEKSKLSDKQFLKSNHKLGSINTDNLNNTTLIGKTSKTIYAKHKSSGKNSSLWPDRTLHTRSTDFQRDSNLESNKIYSNQNQSLKNLSLTNGSRNKKTYKLKTLQRKSVPLLTIPSSISELESLRVESFNSSKKFSPWDFGIGAAFSTNLLGSDHGAGIKTRLAYKATPCLSIESGLGILGYLLDDQLQEDIDYSKLDSEEIESVSNPNKTGFEQDITNFITSTTKQYQLVANLGISKSISNNLNFSIGAKYRNTFYRNTPLLQGNDLSTHSLKLELDQNLIFRNHFFNPYIGLSYNFADSFSLRMEADISNLSYIRQASDSSFSKKTSFLQTEVYFRF